MADYRYDEYNGCYYSTDNFQTIPPLMYHEPLCFSATFKVLPQTKLKLFYAQGESVTSLVEWLENNSKLDDVWDVSAC